jgi:hypothetical protein
MPKVVKKQMVHETNGHAGNNAKPSVLEREQNLARLSYADPLKQKLNERKKAACSPAPEKKVMASPKPEADLPELATDPNLTETIQRDIAAIGLVGEQDLGLLLYLTGTSRLLPEPLRLIIQGPSGSGKSEIPRRVVPMFPPDAVLEATSITPNALYYMPPGSLEHKLIVGGERMHRVDPDAADATAALRQLISEGRIRKLVTLRSDGSRFEAKMIEQNGPVAYVETTTSSLIFKEDLNRCILLMTDDSPEQTRKVLQAKARRYSPTPERETVDTQAIIDRHREFQQSIEKCTVVIPYAEVLAVQLPAGRIETRRAITQVLGTIEAVALLHQHQRGRDDQSRLIADRHDYETARRLLLKPLSGSIGLSDKAQKAYDTLKKKLPREFTSTEAEKAGDFGNRMTCNRALKELEAMNVLQCIAKGKSHMPARWKWTGKTLDELVLPSVEALFVTS